MAAKDKMCIRSNSAKQAGDSWQKNSVYKKYVHAHHRRRLPGLSACHHNGEGFDDSISRFIIYLQNLHGVLGLHMSGEGDIDLSSVGVAHDDRSSIASIMVFE